MADCLAMVQAGACGETAEQIGPCSCTSPAAVAAGHRPPGWSLREFLAGEAKPRGVKLTSATSLRAAKGFGVLLESFLMIREHYHSSVNEVLVADSPESSRRAITPGPKSLESTAHYGGKTIHFEFLASRLLIDWLRCAPLYTEGLCMRRASAAA